MCFVNSQLFLCLIADNGLSKVFAVLLYRLGKSVKVKNSKVLRSRAWKATYSITKQYSACGWHKCVKTFNVKYFSGRYLFSSGNSELSIVRRYIDLWLVPIY